MNYMKDSILIDTNILIYAETSDDLKKHEKTAEFFANYENLSLSIQNLTEFSSNMIKKTNLSSTDINNIVQNYIDVYPIVFFSESTIQEANRISRDYKLHFFDSLLVATMSENNIKKIVTENVKDFKKVPWLEIIKPF